MSHVVFGSDVLETMVRAVEKVRERLLRTAAILEAAGIPYAVVGGNAVAAWVSTVDPGEVRNTQDVDLLIRRSDLEAAKLAMEAAGFRYRHVKGIDMFLDGPESRVRDAVHLLFSGEKVRAEDLVATPEVTQSAAREGFRVIELEPLVRMKLTSYRRKDQVHLLDMIEVGLINTDWPGRLPAGLATRLRELLDNPEG